MDIEKTLTEYDAMFGNYELQDIEAYLREKIGEAKKERDMGAVVTLLNEIIGFCRDTTQKDKALAYCDELKALLDEMQLEGSISYATSLLNIANAYRAFGLFHESLEYFQGVYEVYKQYLEADDFSYASLFNNWGLLYQEMEEYEKARDILLKALSIVDLHEEAVIPQATTRTNLAVTLLQLNTQKDYEDAIQYLKEALEVFEADGGSDFHYGAALVAMGDAYTCKKEYEKAEEAYKKGLAEIEKHVGRTDNYNRVLEKYEYVKNKCKNTHIRNLEKSREFYEQYAKPMMHRLFADYENRIAVGLVGEGSDCFGFDDAISMDHDYAVGLCMWLESSDYEKIGKKLQTEYEKLVEKDANQNTKKMFLQNRQGVFSINDFYNGLLETNLDYEAGAQPDYLSTKEFQFAAATNGCVFVDELGTFSAVRNRLKAYYPQDIYRAKLAQSIHEFSQYAQSNYARMMARKDFLTAQLCIAKAVERTMDIVYLLNKQYAPYYKWKKKGMEVLTCLQEVIPLLEEIVNLPCQKSAWEHTVYNAASVNREDQCVCLFEQIAGMLLQEMKRQQLVSGEDTFLEVYMEQIMQNKKKVLVEKVIEEEWKQFDQVKNEGGRADCQDDFGTFSIMRKSQYLVWTEEMLESYYQDLVAADEKGWNLIMEKYARMMKSTAPQKYAELEKDLPVLSSDRIAIQEEIIKIQVAWMEEFAQEYPKIASTARCIHTFEDTEYDTSYETYLRGELGTYSETTFLLYGRFVAGLSGEKKNLAYEIMSNTVKLYGYLSLEEAEKKL